MKKGLIALVLVASAGLASVAHAQNFKVLLNGQPYGSQSGLYASGSNVTIDVGAIDVQPWTELHIFDPDVPSSGFPDDSAGMITIKGSSAQRLILIWIADAPTTSDDAFFLSLPDSPQQPGLKNLGGVQFVDEDGLQVDTSLRDNALLSATVAGNINGPITAGAIYRVDGRWHRPRIHD